MYSQWMQQNPELMNQAMQRYGAPQQAAPITAPPPPVAQQAAPPPQQQQGVPSYAQRAADYSGAASSLATDPESADRMKRFSDIASSVASFYGKGDSGGGGAVKDGLIDKAVGYVAALI